MSETATLGAKIAKACLFHGGLSPNEIMAGLLNGTYKQWNYNDSILVTSLVTREEGPCCRVVLAAGSLPDIWRAHDEQVVPWAQERGRKYMIGSGRPPWRKVSEPKGYRYIGDGVNPSGKRYVTMLKEI